MLAKLGVSCSDKNLVAVLKALDLSGNGVLEFEEFSQFILVDPYTQVKF
jgi:Ca2+-binding EF-hand superfamily protein